MAKDAKQIAKALAEMFRELGRKGVLTRDGKKVAAAMNKLREERRLTWEQLHRPVTI